MNKYFTTQSLNVVAWLMSKGFAIDSTVNINNSTTFNFIKTQELMQSVNEYSNNITLKKFLSAYREIKDIVASNKK